MRFLRRHRDLDARVDHARREAEESRERLDRARAEVIRPLRDLSEQNRFADLIRASLAEGHRRK